MLEREPPAYSTQHIERAAFRPSVARTAAEYRNCGLPPTAARRSSVFEVFCATNSRRKKRDKYVSPMIDDHMLGMLPVSVWPAQFKLS